MGHPSRKSTEARLLKMAKAYVAMKSGDYEWPDGRPHLDQSGAPRVENRELLRVGGYSPNYQTGGRRLFEDPYFQRQVALETARRQQAFAKISSEPDDLRRTLFAIASNAFLEANRRITECPEDVSLRDLIRFGSEVLELVGGVPDKPEQTAAEPPQIGVYANNLLLMSGDEREQYREQAAARLDQRRAQLETMVEAANALDEEDDGAGDADAAASALG